MATASNPRQSPINRELNRAMAACLRLMLKDLWARYHRVKAEAERLKKASDAVGDLYKQVRNLDEKRAVRKKDEANTNRRVQRTRV